MGASPGQIEVWDDIVSIMGAEPGALGGQRLQAEGAAQMRRQVAAEIGRGIMKLGDDARTDVGDQAMLDLVQYALCIGGGEPVPVDRQLAQMRQDRKSTRLNSSH